MKYNCVLLCTVHLEVLLSVQPMCADVHCSILKFLWHKNGKPIFFNRKMLSLNILIPDFIWFRAPGLPGASVVCVQRSVQCRCARWRVELRSCGDVEVRSRFRARRHEGRAGRPVEAAASLRRHGPSFRLGGEKQNLVVLHPPGFLGRNGIFFYLPDFVF